MPPRYGQLVIGPPGSGKTTYCSAMYDFLTKIGRKVLVINLDPANDDNRPEPCHICITELTGVTRNVAKQCQIGPNAAIMECFEKLAADRDWLVQRLQEFPDNHYMLFDCPGQVELYTHQQVMRKLVRYLGNTMDARLCAVNLVDAVYCEQANLFVSVVLSCLNFMMQLELPHVNVFTKLDRLAKYQSDDGQSSGYSTEMYTEVLDLKKILNTCVDGKQSSADVDSMPYHKLNVALCGLIEDYSLVCFSAISVKDRASMAQLLCEIDRAVGFVTSDRNSDAAELMSYACRPSIYRQAVNQLFEQYRQSRN